MKLLAIATLVAMAVPTALVTGSTTLAAPRLSASPRLPALGTVEPATPPNRPQSPASATRPSPLGSPYPPGREAAWPRRNPRLVRVQRQIQRAQTQAEQVALLAAQVRSTVAEELTAYGQRSLEAAQTASQNGQVFQASEQAKAARNLFEAAGTLYEAELGYKVGRYGPEGPSRSYYEAPYLAPEELARTESALEIYGISNSTIDALWNQAQTLAGSVTPVSTPTTLDFETLARSRAAVHLARAIRHLAAAERQF